MMTAPSPSLLDPSCLLPMYAPASAYHCVVSLCPIVRSVSEDQVCLCDDAESVTVGVR
jgi:hypothetical protein